MQKSSAKQPILNPTDRELVECVKKAACQHFEIDEHRLISDNTPTVANIRFLCFWIITQNTELKDYMIGTLFKKTRSAIGYGVDLIDAHKNTYRQTLDNLRSIARIANKFEKNYTWDIQPINMRP